MIDISVLSRLYEKYGEAAVRSFSQFYPTITPADVMTMAHHSHFLAYLDNLVQSQTEEHRYICSFTFVQKQKKNFLSWFYDLNFLLQVVIFTIPPGTRISETGLAGARTHS